MSTLEQALNQKNDADIVRKGVVRFGDGENDFFRAAGRNADFEALTDILAKVAESPALLKKMRHTRGRTPRFGDFPRGAEQLRVLHENRSVRFKNRGDGL